MAKVKVCDISIEKELKTAFLHKCIDNGIIQFKIYDVCRELLASIRGHKNDTTEQKNDYIIRRENLIYESTIMNKCEVLSDLFIDKISDDIANTLCVYNIYDYIIFSNYDDIIFTFKNFYDKINVDVIDKLLIFNIGMHEKQLTSIEKIAALFDYPIDDKYTNEYNELMRGKQHITRKILRDIMFYVSSYIVHGNNKEIDNDIKNAYKRLSHEDNSIVSRVISDFMNNTTIDKTILNNFIKLIETKKK